MRTPEQILRDAGVAYTVHAHHPVATVAQILEALPFPAEKHVKTLAFDADGRVALVALRGSDRVRYGQLALRAETGLTRRLARRGRTRGARPGAPHP